MVVVKQFLDTGVSLGTLDMDPRQPLLTTLGPDLEQTDVTPEAVDTGWRLVEVVAVVAMTLMVAAILAGNLLVVASVARFRRLQAPTNYLLLALAAADMCVAVAAPFFLGVEVTRDRRPLPLPLLPPGAPAGLAALLPSRVLATACGVSMLTLGAVAYDRYTSLASPLEYAGVITKRRVALFVGGSWVLAGLVAWLPLCLPGMLEQQAATAAAGASSLRLVPAAAHLLFIAALFLPVCLTMFLCYARIYAVARRHARAIAAVERSVHRHTRGSRYQPKDAKYAKTLVLIMGVFLALWLPYLTCSVVDIFDQTLVPDWVRNFLVMMAVLNSGLNPWLYAYKNFEFRNAFSRMLKEKAARWWLCWHEADRRSSVLSDSSVYHASTSSSGAARHFGHHPHHHLSHQHLAHCNPVALAAADFVRVPHGTDLAASASSPGVAADQNFSTFPRVVPRLLYPYAVEGQGCSHEQQQRRQSLRGSGLAAGGQLESGSAVSLSANFPAPTVRLVVHNAEGGNSHTHTVQRLPSGLWPRDPGADTPSPSPVLLPPPLEGGEGEGEDGGAGLRCSRPSTRHLLLVHSKKCGREALQGLIVEPDGGHPCPVLVPHCDLDKLLGSLHSRLPPALPPGLHLPPLPAHANPLLLHCDKRQPALAAAHVTTLE